ncbi:hypothetical protein QCA50_018903 [Cerrena zonata]|uniref:Transposase n=1 Tax=Cerrena zonata TaxID=2478898 RepID=A0AAW0FG85_9APHY
MDYYKPYRRFMRAFVGDTYEVYVRILNILNKHVRDTLEWNTENWRVLNACHACCYKLKDEPPLRFNRFFILDGNNSLCHLKLFGNHQVADSRVMNDSSYYLSDNYVNQFASRHNTSLRKPPPVGVPLDEAPADDFNGNDNDEDVTSSPLDDENDPTDGRGEGNTNNLDTCAKNWKAAAANEKKQTWDIFDETGIFASACRHGLILWLIDMVQSGELAKYPLAMVAKALEVLGEDLGGAYDIGCSFSATVRNSSLAAEAKAKNLLLFVNTFHGYTHSYSCQTKNHPNVIKGVGLEDFETLEHIFSLSNQLTTITHYASRYRHRLLIDSYFCQWDEDKYLNLGTFILNNY